MARLTLTIDQAVISRSKEYARRHGVSVSEMVQAYLSAVSQAQPRLKEPPVLNKLRGLLKAGGRDDCRKHLEEKCA